MAHRLLFLFCLSAAIDFISITSGFCQSGFSNGFPANPRFFPIGVWQQDPSRVPQYKDLGINVFVGLWQGPTEQQLAALDSFGMFTVTNQNDAALNSKHNRIVKAWLDFDEPDNAQPTGPGQWGTCIPAKRVAARTEEMKSNDPSRPVMIGFGQGIADEAWIGRGPCTGDMGYYKTASKGAAILSFDIYPVGSNSAAVKGKLEYVAKGVTNLRKIASPDQIVWDAIETSAIDPGIAVRPEQVRSEVWMSLIHGSRGIIYFVHEFTPFREDGVFNHPDVVAEIRKINREILDLAPVLNSPTADGSVNASGGVATMAKMFDGELYVFAAAMSAQPVTARIRLKDESAVEVKALHEGRTLPVAGGEFADAFAGYGVHIYKLKANAS